MRRFIDLRALNGYGLIDGGEIVGYLYYVVEEGKGLIGDLYVRRAYRTVDRENRLLEAALDAMMASRSIRRIESQLMMLQHAAARPMPRADSLSVFERNFMRVDLRRATLAEGRVRYPMYLEKWSDHYQDAAAQLIATAYTGHVDSRINDQYRSAAGARRFLYNIVQYPGCGAFTGRHRTLLSTQAAAGYVASRWQAWWRPSAGTSRRFASRRRCGGRGSATRCCGRR